MKIEDVFIPHALALEVARLGFEWGCVAQYLVFSRSNPEEGVLCGCGALNLKMGGLPNNAYLESDNGVTAPTWDQIFDWFRSEYGLEHIICPTYGVKQTYYCMVDRKIIEDSSLESLKTMGVSNHKLFDTYKEAQTACLEKLIQTVKDL